MGEIVRVNADGTMVKYEKSFTINGETFYYSRTISFNDLKVLVDALDAQFNKKRRKIMNERIKINVNGIIVKMYEKSFVINGQTLYHGRTVTFNDLNILITALNAQFKAGMEVKEIDYKENHQYHGVSVEFSNIKDSRLIPFVKSLEEKLGIFKSNYAVTSKIGKIRPQNYKLKKILKIKKEEEKDNE